MPGHAEGVAEHDVGGLAADAGQRHEVLERGRAPRRRTARRAPGRARSASWSWPGRSRWSGSSPRARRGRRRRSRRRSGTSRTAPGVTLLTRSSVRLRGQDRRHRQLERGGEVELAVGVRIGVGELPVDAPGPAGAGQRGLARTWGGRSGCVVTAQSLRSVRDAVDRTGDLLSRRSAVQPTITLSDRPCGRPPEDQDVITDPTRRGPPRPAPPAGASRSDAGRPATRPPPRAGPAPRAPGPRRAARRTARSW